MYGIYMWSEWGVVWDSKNIVYCSLARKMIDIRKKVDRTEAMIFPSKNWWETIKRRHVK
jgi:hypothetical protein